MSWYHSIRYETNRWPWWRFDLTAAYFLKSINHKRSPDSWEDNRHYLAMNRWLQQGEWRAISDEPVVSLKAVGDLMWIPGGWDKSLSSGVKNSLGQADVTFADIETPLDPSRKVPQRRYQASRSNAPTNYLLGWQDLPSHAQHVFSICNNHALDQEEQGLYATRNSILQRCDTFHCLGGINDGEDIQLLDIKGIKMGFMASTFAINHLQHDDAPPEGITVLAFGNKDAEPNWQLITDKINKLKSQGAEYIVFSPHWGYEFEYWPDAVLKTQALKLIELGVDLILGHSPHVLQPVELVSINEMDLDCPLQITRPGNKGFAVIAWSLGNFISVMPTLECKTGVILELDLVKHEGHILIKNLELRPVYTTQIPDGARSEKQVMTLNEITEEQLAKQILRHCQQISPLVV